MDDTEVIEQFRRELTAGALAGLSVLYRVAGGPPSERMEVGLELAGDGELRWRKLDLLQAADPQEGRRSLDQATTRNLLTKVASVFEEFVPREGARFPPDSLVGSLTIRLSTGEATRFFLAEQEARRQEGQIGPQAEEVLSRFEDLIGTDEAGGGAP